MNNLNSKPTVLRSKWNRPAVRRGVTLLEVMFATGIAMAGMLGIASLLLVAGRQASDSNRSLESQTLAQDWYNELLTRGMDNPSSWVWYQDFQFPTVAAGAPGLRQFSKQMYGGSFNVGRLTHSVGSQSPANSNVPFLLRPRGKMSVCIDPYFYSDRTIRSTISSFGEVNDCWYRPAVFPYYQDGFNPMTDSEYRTGTTGGLAWSDQPRMLRVSLGSPSSVLNEKQVESMFASTNELTMLASEDDRTLPASRGYQALPSGGTAPTLVPFKASYQPHYSWMATLSPLEEFNTTSENFYTLSLAVIYQRDRLFVPPAFPERVSPLPQPEDKPQGERLTWVVPLSGNFTGGSGGRVRLIASSGTDTSVSVGDWIMLSKHLSGTQRVSGGGDLAVEAYSAFRWFRVVATDEKPTELPFTNAISDVSLSADPFGNSNFGENIWARDIVLDGPDWNFAGAAPVQLLSGSMSQMPSPTTGTLVKGVVAVHERIIEISAPGDF